MAHRLITAQGTLPVGSDAYKGFFVVGVPDDKQFNCVTASYSGGDSNEIYSLAILPAGYAINDTDIDATIGVIQWMEQAKGGQVAPLQAMFPRIVQTGVCVAPGPCSIVVYSNTSPAAVFTVALTGTISDLGESLV